MRNKHKISIGIFVIVAISMICLVLMRSQGFPLMMFDQEIINEQEYIEAIKETDDEIKEKSQDSLRQAKIQTEKAIDALLYRHALYQLGYEQGYVDSIKYADLLHRMRQENQIRKRKKENGEVVYGLLEFTPRVFMTYEMQRIRELYCAYEKNPGMQLSQQEIEDYYQSRIWELDGVGTNAPLSKVKDIVIQQLRQAKLENLIQKRKEKIKVKVDWDLLYAFTLKYSAK